MLKNKSREEGRNEVPAVSPPHLTRISYVKELNWWAISMHCQLSPLAVLSSMSSWAVWYVCQWLWNWCWFYFHSECWNTSLESRSFLDLVVMSLPNPSVSLQCMLTMKDRFMLSFPRPSSYSTICLESPLVYCMYYFCRLAHIYVLTDIYGFSKCLKKVRYDDFNCFINDSTSIWTIMFFTA